MAMGIILAGGTGLVGRLLSDRLDRRSDLAVDSLVRTPQRPCERAIDFEALLADPHQTGSGPADVAISCLGTTLRAAGSPDAFRRVDRDYVLAFARAAKTRDATRFIMVSSVGAGGGGLYLTTKGETEEAVTALNFGRVDLLRPSLLLGPRSDRRPGETLAQAAAPLINPLLLGPLARYAALDAGVVADAIEALIDETASGVHVHQVPELRRLSGRMRSSPPA